MADAPVPPNDTPPPGSSPPPTSPPPDEIPWGQRFFDRPFLLLFLGILIMAVFFTGWGLWEITSLPPAPLP
ncbi:MAG: hypothetical protein RLN75_04920 [Longimicrobiales bacterium]